MFGQEMDWILWAQLVVGSMVAGVALLWMVAGYYHVKYYVRRRDDPDAWKCQPKRFLRPEQDREAALLSSFNLALGGFVTANLIYFWLKGWGGPKLYLDVDEYGWAYTIVSTLVLYVMQDALAYYAHRALHIKPLFRRIHRYHHKYVATTPFVVTAMHPLELLILQGASFIPLFIFPFHAVAVAALLGYALFFNILNHSGIRLASWIPWQGSTMFHDDHHAHFHCNFGQHMQFWDRIHGTLRRANRRYGVENFGGKGVPAGGGPDEFVRY